MIPKNRVFFILILALAYASFGQIALIRNDWALGAGITNAKTESLNMGAFINGQRTISMHMALRAKASYSLQKLERQYGTDFAFLYYAAPSDPISPYLFAGMGMQYNDRSHAASADLKRFTWGSFVDLGAGVAYALNATFDIQAELGYSLPDLDERDPYLVTRVGILYPFGKRDKPELCNPCKSTNDGRVVGDLTDYRRIEDLIIRNLPKEVETIVIKETVCGQPQDSVLPDYPKDPAPLFMIQFALNQSELSSESITNLQKGLVLFNEKPFLHAEIQSAVEEVSDVGNTQDLNRLRANAIKAFLVSHGLDVNRISIIGYGRQISDKPMKNEAGNEINQRVVFKIGRNTL